MITENKLNATDWVDLYGDALYAYVMARVANSAQAEDIVQETFLSAWRARETYNGTASEKTWLYTICKNKIIDYYRKASTNKEVLAKEDETEAYFFGDDGRHWNDDKKPQAWGIDYSKSIESKEFYSILKKCKTKLKEIQQSVLQ